MTQSVFVISDLHLGGAPGFQMCSPAGQERLSDFVRWVAEQGPDVHLVLAGDVVDFLSEMDDGKFAAFTSDEPAALRKLAAITSRTRRFWRELGGLVQRGASLTLLLGNHDIELSLPGPRRFLLDLVGPGRVEFIYDNQALTIGSILVEHGNRYDGWNAVHHDGLRRARSRLSRGHEPAAFTVQPGSALVVEVMNVLKAKYAFVDLLKPETEAVLPLLAYLDPPTWHQAWRVVRRHHEAARVTFSDRREPENPDQISGSLCSESGWQLAHRLAAGGSLDTISSGTRPSFWRRWAATLDAAEGEVELQGLAAALGALRAGHTRAFSVDHEEDDYLLPAQLHIGHRSRVVVYGHTHLAKRVPVGTGVYLNSGTWADILRVPNGAFTDREVLRAFANDLAVGDLGAYRHQVPTFAWIVLEAGQHTRADVHVFDPDSGNPAVTSAELATRLGPCS